MPENTQQRTTRRLNRKAAVLCLALAGAVTASLLCAPAAAAEPWSATRTQTWLDVSVAGDDENTYLTSVGVPGGGEMVAFFQKAPVNPDKDTEEPDADTIEERRLTLTVDGDVVAGDAALVEGKMSLQGDLSLEQRQEDGTTVVEVTSTGSTQTVFLLPEQVPRAADPDDQNALQQAWTSIVDWITGDDDDTQDGDNDNDDQSADDASTGDSPSDDAGDDADDDDTSGKGLPTSTPTTSPTGSPEDHPTDDGEVCDAASPTSPPTDDAKQRTQRDDYAVEDGPGAAPTFRTTAMGTNADCDDSEGAEPSDQTTTGNGNEATSSASRATRIDLQVGDWLSGAAGDPEGIGELRGAPSEIATTWAKGPRVDVDIPQLQDGGEYGRENWNKSLFLALSPFNAGETWEQAADGAYDARWRKALQNAKTGWGERNGQLFIEWGFELNGYWFDWGVTQGQEEAVGKAWSRFRDLQQEIFPQALLGPRFNRESNGYDGNSEDLLAAIADHIDFVGISYYNHYPYAGTAEEFEADLDDRDGGGGPKGLRAWLKAAANAGDDGLPVTVGEWGGSAKNGDSPAYIKGMYGMFSTNAGPGAGQIAAESMFEIDKDNNNWKLLGATKMPESTLTYAELFARTG